MNGRSALAFAILTLLFALCGASGAEEVNEPKKGQQFHIVGIRFEGNTRTKEHILRQEMGLSEGDTVTTKNIEAARQAIMDLGLFKWVRVSQEPASEGTVLVFSMEEKFFLLPVPLVNGDPNKGDYSYGMELTVDNLGGLNQRLKLKYEQDHSQSDEVPFKRIGSINYNYPRVLGTTYNLGLSYRLSQEKYNYLDENGVILAKYHRNVTSISGGVSRWFRHSGPSGGWFGGLGASYQQRKHELLTGPPGLLDTTQSISVTANLGTKNVHDHGFYLTGDAYGWNGEVGSKMLGSDYDYTRHLFYYRDYNHFGENANLNWQMRVGLAKGKPFDGFAYSIGGFTTLRGHEEDIEGNALLLSNLEYQHRLDGWPSLRGVWFLDAGNAYDSVSDVNLRDLEAGSGLGVRWKVQSLVDVTLSMDLAYGIGEKNPVFYVMTTGTF